MEQKEKKSIARIDFSLCYSLVWNEQLFVQLISPYGKYYLSFHQNSPTCCITKQNDILSQHRNYVIHQFAWLLDFCKPDLSERRAWSLGSSCMSALGERHSRGWHPVLTCPVLENRSLFVLLLFSHSQGEWMRSGTIVCNTGVFIQRKTYGMNRKLLL